MKLTPSEKDLLISMLEERVNTCQCTIEELNHEGGEVMRAIPLYENVVRVCCNLIEKLGGTV